MWAWIDYSDGMYGIRKVSEEYPKEFPDEWVSIDKAFLDGFFEHCEEAKIFQSHLAALDNARYMAVEEAKLLEKIEKLKAEVEELKNKLAK